MDELATYARKKRLEKIRAYQKEYRQRPEVKAKQKAYMDEYNKRPEVIEKRKVYSKKKAMEERIIKAIEVLTAAGYIVTVKGE